MFKIFGKYEQFYINILNKIKKNIYFFNDVSFGKKTLNNFSRKNYI